MLFVNASRVMYESIGSNNLQSICVYKILKSHWASSEARTVAAQGRQYRNRERKKNEKLSINLLMKPSFLDDDDDDDIGGYPIQYKSALCAKKARELFK